MPACDYIANLRDRTAACAALESVFDDFDVLMLPTTPIVAPGSRRHFAVLYKQLRRWKPGL
jgi:Asp-tRNA(Asn)/Glu-tRNA(Gln) amidotransferase A subunit family amidase